MKRKLEDQLMEMAFGELTSEEAARLAQLAQTDPEAARALESYRKIREGLQCMREVPEPQLSNERLRDAILRRGLPGRGGEMTVRRWSWTWVPVGALALAFSLTMLRNPAVETPVLVEDMGGAAVERSALALNAPMAKVDGLLPPPVSAPSVGPTAAQVTSSAGPRERPPRRRTRVASRSERSTVVAPPSASLSAPAMTATMAAAPMAAALPGAASSAPSDEGTVILILPQKDDATGAQVATEVQNRSDVLIGG